MTDETFTVTVTVPDEASCEIDGHTVTIDGPEGSITKELTDKRITVSVDDDTITLTYPQKTKTAKRVVYSNASLIRNAVHGAIDKWTYTMKVCSGHFPMQVQIQGDELVIENFTGETVPRRVTIEDDVDVSIDGDTITISSLDKERAGQTAGRIENICKRSGFDERIFQDGIYITEKPEGLSQKR